ncbi:hypothetical protein G7Y89_g7154 [Cudoniella acicularis]|uniref:Uncharacterized protein n=1 Tax=Cudoniella acicularis TaxID=354080 RepID=A0A8H4RKZ0_9HELO|nr:hypothetical protein G7Y89_g7154 [Cudoniella acicularis]
MARTKSQVVTARESPEAVRPRAAPAVISNHFKQTSGSVTSSAASSTCPHCNSVFSDLPPKDFRHHVASCTRPSTATDDDSSDSSLTPPPDSPSIANCHTITVDANPIEDEVPAKIEPGTVKDLALNDVTIIREVDRPIRPYINPDTQFEYYDKQDDREGSVATRRNSEEPEESKSSTNGVPETSSEEKGEIKIRHPFAKFTPIEIFDDYLANPEEMPYEELYRRTDKVASVLVDYQKEWDTIEKEVNAHESWVKAQNKKATEAAKITEEEKSKIEDQKYLELNATYKAEIKLSRGDWDRFLENVEAENPNDPDLLDRLRALRLPNFMTAIHKRQKAREPETAIKLVDRPLMAERITKEELALDKRKRGRLIDQITFEDMKHADIYGFNYSSQPHHVGNQPQPTFNGKTKGRGEVNDEGRSRSQRTKIHRSYDADKSVTPESESDELPAKRIRKPRNLDAGIDSQPRPRTPLVSRGGTPAVRTFPSGKRVGRPPAKSKLKDVQLPPASTSPALENGTVPRMLAPKEEEQLHDAAELLVKQTRRTRTQSIGGDSSDATSAASSRPSTSSSNDHGPKRKNRGSQNTDPETLVVKSAPLEKGEMTGAMKTRKATNAAEKAKKAAEQAAAVATARRMPLEPGPGESVFMNIGRLGKKLFIEEFVVLLVLKRGGETAESNRPTYTRLSHRHLSTETLNRYCIDFEFDTDPGYLLVKRWVPEYELDFLWSHTREIREKRESATAATPISIADKGMTTTHTRDDREIENAGGESEWKRKRVYERDKVSIELLNKIHEAIAESEHRQIRLQRSLDEMKAAEGQASLEREDWNLEVARKELQAYNAEEDRWEYEAQYRDIMEMQKLVEEIARLERKDSDLKNEVAKKELQAY